MVLLACFVMVLNSLRLKSYTPFLPPGCVPPQGLAEPLSSKPPSPGVPRGQSDSQTTLIQVGRFMALVLGNTMRERVTRAGDAGGPL